MIDIERDNDALNSIIREMSSSETICSVFATATTHRAEIGFFHRFHEVDDTLKAIRRYSEILRDAYKDMMRLSVVPCDDESEKAAAWMDMYVSTMVYHARALPIMSDRFHEGALQEKVYILTMSVHNVEVTYEEEEQVLPAIQSALKLQFSWYDPFLEVGFPVRSTLHGLGRDSGCKRIWTRSPNTVKRVEEWN